MNTNCKNKKKSCHRYSQIIGSAFPITAQVLYEPTLWLEARNTGTTYPDGGLVNSWNDLSGHNRHMSQPGIDGLKPVYNTNGIKPYIDFDDSNKTINRGAQSITDYVGVSEGTIILMMQHYDSVQPCTPYSWNAADTSNNFKSHCSFNDNNIYIDWGNSSSGAGRCSGAEPSGWHTGFHIVEFRRIGNDLDVVVDGVEIFTDNYTGGLIGGSSTFGFGNIAGFGFRLSAAMFWDKALSNSQKDIVRLYLTTFKP